MQRLSAVLVLLVSLAAIPLAASEAFILDIPIRGNTQQETGEVRVLFGLNAAPAGAQLVVNGATTLNLGDTVNVAGDSISFAAGSGNEVLLTYKPLSNFGADFCTAVNAQEKFVPMRFVGAQDILDYRVATYIVAAPAAECSKVSKHTGDTPAMISPNDDGVAPALVADYKGRFPYDVILVLDKSGSMNELPPGANAGANKASILKSATQAFVANWQSLDAPIGVAEWSHDRLGLVFFDSTATAQTFAGGDPPATVFLQRGNGNAWNAVITAANGLTPGSSTSIGAGVNLAMQNWKNDPKNDLSLVVVTDGKQNTLPKILPTNTGFLGLDPVAGLPQELRKRFIPIQSVGFGTPAQVDEDLLRNMPLETSGASYMDLNAFTVFDDFATLLIAILKGNTASIARRAQETLTGVGPSNPHTVLVDRSPQRVVFSLQWAPPLANALDLDVFRPGAAAPSAPSSSKKVPQAAIQTFDLKPSDAGAWNVRVKRAAKADLVNVPYTLNVLFLERNLDYQLSIDNFRAYTGDKLVLRAVVDWDGKRLGGLRPGSIRARVLAPPQAFGTILHNTRQEVRVPASIGGDPQSPLDQKIASFKGNSLVERLEPKEVATITLTEESRGVYTGAFDKTLIPGGYIFDVILDWDNERSGRIHREERVEQFVKLRADRTKTDVTTTRDANGVYTISVTPRDSFGNYFGPGYASVITARVRTRGKLRSDTPSDRNLIGVYSFEVVDVPAGETPQLDIVVDGVSLTRRE